MNAKSGSESFSPQPAVPLEYQCGWTTAGYTRCTHDTRIPGAGSHSHNVKKLPADSAPNPVEFDYSFVVWPHERGWEPSMFELFGLLNARVWMTFTEDKWGVFRSSLERQGITIREAERQPHHEPEIVRL